MAGGMRGSGWTWPRVWSLWLAGLVAVAVIAWVSTASGATLPDGRGYELVSPPDKNGGDVLAITRRTRAARAGGLVGFASLVGFADAFGMGYSADYLATRGSGGWSTRGITPRQEPQDLLLSVAGPADRIYVNEFAEDFSKGVARATAFPGVPANVATVHNLLLREDLLAPGVGRYQLLTNSVAPIPVQSRRRGFTPLGYQPLFVDASADFGHVVFQSHLNLTADATGDFQKLYEWDHGTLRLVGVLPDATISENAVAGRSVSGPGGRYVDHIVSDDGARIYFTVQDEPALGTSDGSTSGQVYLRQSATSTVQVNASEKSVPDPPGSAEFWTASADGSKAFFTTAEQLVDEDTNPAPDLYRFDAAAPDGSRLRLLSVDNEPADGTGAPVQLALGASDDGQRVYFVVQSGQLVAGAPLPGDSVSEFMYLWDEGMLKYVGEADRFDLRDMAGDSFGPKSVRVTPEGQHLLFITGGQVHVYSAQANSGAGELSCASCPPDGSPPTASAGIDFAVGAGLAGRTPHRNRPLNDDGLHVFFTTRQALVGDDHNTSADVYEFAVVTRTVHLISSGHAGAGDAAFMDASGDGSDVFFTTREQLVGWDVDQAVDLYDARVGGGFPEPVLKRLCRGAGCRRPVSPPPDFAVPASVMFDGAGNVTRGRRR